LRLNVLVALQPSPYLVFADEVESSLLAEQFQQGRVIQADLFGGEVAHV
jgi:hypothetical protein